MQHDRVRLVGVFLLGLAVGGALMNDYRTEDALRGAGQWWQGYCHSQVQSHVQLQKDLDGQ